MFNNSFKKECGVLKEDLYSLNQVKESLEQEMLVMKLDTDGVVKSINTKFIDDLGIQEIDIIGKNLTELTPSHSRDTKHYNDLVNALKEIRHWAGAIEIEKENGEEVWLRAIFQPILFGSTQKIKEFSLHCNDLTRTIVSAREDQNIIAALQRSTAVIEFDMSGHILTANEIFLNSMGYQLGQIKGQHHRIFCAEEELNSSEYGLFWERLNQGQFF